MIDVLKWISRRVFIIYGRSLRNLDGRATLGSVKKQILIKMEVVVVEEETWGVYN